jgi:RsiW-degrading membrane proteinase PrsW (M82 family)
MTAPYQVAPAYPVAPRNRKQTGVGTFVSLAALGVLFLVTMGVVAYAVGEAALPAAAVLAVIPLLAVIGAVLWVDRWEPEPWPALGVAFGWGASVAVLVALVLNTGAMLVLSADSTVERAGVVSAVFVAPVVEESIKGAGVLIVFLAWRRFFDGPTDGLVYAATVAGGFAFVENITYFGAAIVESAGTSEQADLVVTVFVLRGVMSPFAHVVFTGCTGLALGLASRHGRNAWLLAFPLGLAGAMVLHGMWNGSAMAEDESFFMTAYLLVGLPIFFTVVAMAVWIRRSEQKVIFERLAELVGVGRISAEDVTMLSSLRYRRRARAWARGRGPVTAHAMKSFQMAATRWAFTRHRALRHRPDVRAWADEMALLSDMDRARYQLVTGRAI